MSELFSAFVLRGGGTAYSRGYPLSECVAEGSMKKCAMRRMIGATTTAGRQAAVGAEVAG